MVYEHEIPKGARLYFGATARLKRDIERVASEELYRKGFEEIVTPLLSYHQHRYIEDERDLIRVNDEQNRSMSVRADSTVDVVRLITKRLGRSTEHRKWFYIQPIYRYPAKEYYQIGAEWLGGERSGELLKILLRIFERLGIRPTLQLSNIRIPLLLSEYHGISLEVLRRSDLDAILSSEAPWVERLLTLTKAEQIDELIGIVPEPIERELVRLKEAADELLYDDVVVAPLYYASMRYYRDLFFRFFSGNDTIAMGGEYVAQELRASGFAIYTDAIIKQKGGV